MFQQFHDLLDFGAGDGQIVVEPRRGPSNRLGRNRPALVLDHHVQLPGPGESFLEHRVPHARSVAVKRLPVDALGRLRDVGQPACSQKRR